MKNNRKLLISSLLGISTIFLSGCSGEIFSSEDISVKISFNVWDFLATFAAFVVLVVVAFYFGYKPIKEMIRKRHEYVDGQIKEAENREQETRSLKEEANANLLSSKKEAIKIVEDAKLLANKEKEQIILDAKEEAKLEKEKAKKDIEQEIEASKDKIHKEIVDVALTASEELLGREITDKDNRRLLDDFVKDIESEDK